MNINSKDIKTNIPAEYYEQEEISLYKGFIFSKAEKKRQRYIPFEFYNKFLKLIIEKDFILFNNKKTKPHERGFITRFDRNNQRYHLIVSFKYFEGKKLDYFFWVRLHRDIKLNEKHMTVVKGFKCPFCTSKVSGFYNFTIHFKKSHISLKINSCY